MSRSFPPRRTRAQAAADRAAILAAADGTKTMHEVVRSVGRAHGDVYADITALRRRGHRVPIRPKGNFDVGAFLYRHFDVDGNLLYVGMTSSPLSRTTMHRSQARWFALVHRIEFVRFKDPVEAIEAEAVAIRDEAPLFNGVRPVLVAATASSESAA